MCYYINIVAPVIQVVSTNYTGFVGSNITLACEIINHGTPPGSFYWRRHGSSIMNDRISTNSTHTTLTLISLTPENHGEYCCVSNGVLTLKAHRVYLHLEGQL